jgi:hypothetical protein
MYKRIIMRLINILFCLLITLNFGYSQSIKRNVIASFGNSSNTANSIIETTFGQPPNIGTISDGNNYLRQGFQQPLYNFIMIPGCTDSLANNYNPYTTIDDGTCLYSPFVFGCTDSTALNYNSLATVDDSSCCSNTSPGWNPLGQDIDGEAVGDRSGFTVSMSEDGNRVAIGAIYNDGNGSNAGHVRIYSWDGSSWVQLGNDIDGEAASDYSGYSVSLSSDGQTVAIGGEGNDGNGTDAGHVRIYSWDGSSWIQLGNDIDGEAASDHSGSSVSINGDGTIVAIGAPANDGNGADAGHVRIYNYDGSSWTQIGQDIDGEAASDRSGGSVSLSSDGTRVAIGSVQNDGVLGDDQGHVRIYENISGTWTQIGQDIDGEAIDDNFGFSVSLSSDGNILASGTPWNSGNGSSSGHVRVFQYDGNNWNQLGSDIDGLITGEHFGYSVALNSNGSTVAIGSDWGIVIPNQIGNGLARVYRYDGSSWNQLGATIYGEAFLDDMWSISLSGDGNSFAFGAKGNDGVNGNNSGHARIFNFITPCNDLGCLDPLALNYDPNATVSDSTCVYPLYGCIDTAAVNYNASANIDDGSCTYCIYGCMDPNAFNYDPVATCPDGSCIAVVSGCTDPAACNYDPAANTDDGSCLTDYGCTDPTATNYDANATCDDGSCTYCIYGCTYAWACNYDANATCDDGSCAIFTGCTDSLACNYDPSIICDDGSCLTAYGCTDPSATNYDANATCDDGSCISCVYGCTDFTACNYDANATCDDGSCILADGCTDPTASNYNPAALCDDGSCVACIYGCTDLAAYNYDASATCDDGLCWYYGGCTDPTACNYDATADMDDGTCIFPDGCADITACNYDASANCDDGSCFGMSGCMDATACNYNATATCDDASCLPAGCTDPTQQNYDASATCDDGSCIPFSFGCMDAAAINYNPAATADNGSCLYMGCTDPTADNYDPLATVDDGSCILT